MTVFYVVFSLLFKRGGANFVLFLLCGLVVWRWFDSTVRLGTNAISNNAALMWQVYLPKHLFPAIVLVTNTARFLVILVLLLIVLWTLGAMPNRVWLALPLLLGVQFLLIMACTSLVAAVVPLLPDLRQVIANGLTLLFFMSGIFFEIRALPEHAQFYFYLNPMATIIESFRSVLLEATWPDWRALGVVAAVSVLGIWGASSLLSRFDRLYPKALIS